MIAEGIYNPVTGEIVKVQGAGTVYNEEKNSIAFGKDTVANGQDQFVFGRMNVKDDTDAFAEIVGGGGRIYNQNYTSTVYKQGSITREAWKIGTTKSDLETYLSALYERNFTIPYWDDRIKSIYRRSVGDGSLEFVLDLTSVNMTNGDMVSSWISISHWTETVMNNGAAGLSYAIESAAAISNVRSGYSDGTGMLGNSSVDSYKMYLAPAYIEGLGLTNNNSIFTRQNIRTLDWSGNEKLAGNLEVGGTIKIGSTTITEAQLQALLAIITESES